MSESNSSRRRFRGAIRAVATALDGTRRKTYEHIDKRGRLPLSLKIFYGNPGFATTSLSFLISVYATDFYVALGAKLAFLSFFTALARSFDVMSDPLMGWWSDSTRHRMGRRRPYMAGGCIFYAILFVLLFTPPTSLTGNNVAYWFGLFYPLFYLLDTFTNVPYEALGPELSDSYEERNQIFFIKKMINFVGTLFAAAMPALLATMFRTASPKHLQCSDFFNTNNSTWTGIASLADIHETYPEGSEKCTTSSGAFCFTTEVAGQKIWHEANNDNMVEDCIKYTETEVNEVYTYDAELQPGNEVPFNTYTVSAVDVQRQAFTIVSALFGVWFVIWMGVLVSQVKERQASTDKGPVPLVPSILRSFKNRAFRPLLAGWALDGLALSALVSMFPFFIRYVVIPDGAKATAAGTSMSPQVCMGLSVVGLLMAAMISSPIWLKISGKFGKYKTWLAYNVVNAVTNILYVVPAEGDPKYTIIISIINGIPVGGQFLIDSILADTIDYDEFLNGVRSEGAFSVFATLIPKFVAIPAGALPLAIINMLGFVPPLDGVNQPQSDHVKSFIRVVFVFLPFVCCVSSFLIKTRFPIRTKELTDKISLGIELHMKGQPAEDPLTGSMVETLKMTEEEEDKIWIFENFNARALAKLVSTGKADHIVTSMRKHTFAGVSLVSFFAMLIVVFFEKLEDPKMSIIPIVSVIGVGLSLCYLGVNVLRLRAAGKLKQLVKDKATMELVAILMKHKESGQRAGDYVPEDDRLLANDANGSPDRL